MEQLLLTKLYIPPHRPKIVSRQRLVEQLNQGLYRKMTLISAPAGFGKTTLVCEWLAMLKSDPATEAKIAWLSLDEADNDPTRFLAYTIAALNQVIGMEKAVGDGALKMLQSTQPPPVDVVLTPLINSIADIPARIILILDDYHHIESTQVVDLLVFFVENLPPNIHLVIATRQDPYLPLARLRVRSQLTELRAVDLRFSSAEAAEFLNGVMGLNLPADNIAALELRTEGWIAGLQLAALSMQGLTHKSDFIKSFTGSHRLVLDYLIEEVLEQQPENIQAFLEQTAILERLCGSLCVAVTGQDESQAILEMLERNNLFIVPLDNERLWYRYHHLFADLLRRRLNRFQPEQISALHGRASEWYEQAGFVDETIEHALSSEQFDKAMDLIEENMDLFWGGGEHLKFQRWLNRLPEEMLFSRPNLCIFQARYLCNRGAWEASERTLSIADLTLSADQDQAIASNQKTPIYLPDSDRVKMQGRLAATRALMCSYQGDVPGIIKYANQALKQLPNEDLSWRSATALTLGNALGFKGDMMAAYQARFEGVQACKASGDIYFMIIANLQLAITTRELGRLQQTIDICQAQLQFAKDHGLSQTRAVGWLLSVWGETLAELDNLEEAVELTKKGFNLTERSGDLQMHGWSFMCLIRVLISSGDLDGADETIQKMEAIAREATLPPWIANQVSAWKVRLRLEQGRLEFALQWMKDKDFADEGKPKLLQEVDYFSLFDFIVLARVLIAAEQFDDALQLLEHLQKTAVEQARSSKVIEITLLQALAWHGTGKSDRALSTLKDAIRTAEPDGFIRIFVDEGRPMTNLLSAAHAYGISSEYVSRLLAAFSDTEQERSDLSITKADQSGLIEPLSERELEVLELIREGLTNTEISARLFVSLNTVKAHTRNIYAKLDSHNRTQAIARAQKLGLFNRRQV